MPNTFRQILGIRFYCGDISGLLDLTHSGNFVVVPAAPALVDLPSDSAYRAALEQSDFAITDSGFMVLLWFLKHGEWLTRISGLKYLRSLVDDSDFRAAGASFWIMPSAADAEANMRWLRTKGFSLSAPDTYQAPHYPTGMLCDPALLAKLEEARPRYIVINLGGGVQERLGHYLRLNLSYRPAIICTGAAIAFLSGQQASISPWADRYVLGWLIRCLNEPRKFFPRYCKAIRLISLLWKHGSKSVSP